MSRVVACLAALMPGIVLAGPGPGDAALEFEPKEPIADEVVRIRITGLPPGATVELRAEAECFGRAWVSTATFTADSLGSLDLSRQAPTAGDYSGTDAMGLFWSMRPRDDAPAAAVPGIAAANITRFDATIDGKSVAKAELKRWMARPGVTITDVHEQGLVGKLFLPHGSERRPAMLVLSGSEGGINEIDAALLASHGYAAFALAYFRADGLPKQLEEIPLEYFQTGLDWLIKQPGVDADRLGVIGASKGGELALLLASEQPRLKAVVARVPSHVAWFGLGTRKKSSWTRGGEPVPFVPIPAAAAMQFLKPPLRLRGLYDAALKAPGWPPEAVIPIERSRAAVLLVSGTDDQLWPSDEMADAVAARLKEHKHPRPVRHLKYDGAGHGLFPAFVPGRQFTSAGTLALGGTPEANARAVKNFTQETREFLKQALEVK